MNWMPDQQDRRSSQDIVSLKTYFDALYEENKRAIEIAERERGAAASVLREEQQRAQDIAEREREKAAQALVGGLILSSKENVERLREHILNQKAQFEAALEAVEGRAILRHDGIEREFLLRQTASDAAVQKAEDAQKEVNIRSNEFRGQLKDQNNTMIPRLESEKESAALAERIRVIEAALQVQVGINSANIRGQDRAQPWAIWGVGAFVSLLIALIVIAVGAYT